MIELFQEAAAVQATLERNGLPFCFIGGIAVARWGESRVTRDLDLTVFAGFGNESRAVDALLARFPSRIPDAREFALARRVLLLTTDSGVDIDVGLGGGLPFEAPSISA